MKSQNRHEQYRGITNSQGTACHTSSALQLIFHCFPDVRDKLLELAVASSDASTHSSDENDDRENNSAEKISNDKFSSIENGAIIRQQEFVYQLAWFFYLLKHAERVRVRTAKESSNHQQPRNHAEISPKVSTSDAKPKSGVRKTSKSSKRQLSARQQAAIAEFMTSVASQRSSRKNRKNLNSASFGTAHVDAKGENVEKSDNNNDLDEKDWNAIKEEKWRALVEIMREEEKQERLRQLEEQKQREQEERELMKDKNAKKYRESLHNVLGERSSGSVGSPGSIGASIPNEGMERRVDDSYRNDRYEESINGSKQYVGSLSYSVTPRLTPPTSRDRPSSHSHRPPNHNYHISTSNPIDPSEFYLYLTQYTNSLLESPSKGNQKGIIRIDTNNVADAAIIFRCLVSTLEFSVTMEIDRLNEALLHLQHEKEEGKFSEEESWLQRIFGLLSQLKEKIQCEWNGALISRIVGKLVIASSDSETPNADSRETPSTTIIQRTKRNGNIERPIPVPFPLPVINQRVSNSTDAAKPRSDSDKNGDGRNYFPSLVDSLRSITIEPNPIRGYDWTSMMKRGDVIEEKCAHHASAVNHMELNQSFEPGQRTSARTDRDGIDSETEEIVRAMEEMDMMQRNVDQCGIMGGGRREEGPSDKSNSTSKQETTSTIQSDKEIARTSIANSNTLRTVNSPIEKDAYYAEAVARLVARPQSLRGSLSSSRASSTSKNGRNSSRFRDSSSTIRYVSSSSNNEYLMSDVPVSPLLSPGANSLSGMEVGGIADSQLYASSDQRITMTYMPSPTNSYASRTDSDSEEESSIDSQVSSVHDSDSTPSCIDDDDIVAGLPGDESSETHSSAIETPSDIDELSLGSFTDDSMQENDFPDTKHSPPAVHMLGNKITHDPALETVSSNTVARGNTPIETNASHAPESSQPGTMFAPVAVSKAFEPAAESKTDTSTSDSSPTASSDSDSSSASAFDDDSTSSSESNSDASSSYTSDSSSDSSTTSSSDSSDEVESSVPVRPGVRCQPQHAETWVTRKETRFCHPLPKNLIFHLKRFEYSTQLGRVEKLCGSFHIPEEIDLSEYCLEQRDQLACGSAINETRICQCGDRFRLTGAIVHVDPLDDSDDLAYGDIPEGHYVTYISQPYYSEKSGEIKYKWVEVDDDRVRSVHHHNSGIVSEKSHSISVESCFQNGEGQTNDVRAALKIIDGCNTYVSSGSRLKAAAKKSSVKEKERRYAYLVVYSRVCSCNNRKSNV